MNLMLPYLLVREFTQLVLRSVDKNVMYQGNRNTGKKVGAVSFDMDFPQIKAFTKQRGITVNDYYFGLLSKTVYQYMSTKVTDISEIPDTVNSGMPINLRQPLKQLSDVSLSNHVVTMPFRLRLNPDFDQALSINQPTLTKIKTSLPVLNAIKHSVAVITSLPFNWNKDLLNYLSDGFTFVLSTPLVTRKRFSFNGN